LANVVNGAILLIDKLTKEGTKHVAHRSFAFLAAFEIKVEKWSIQRALLTLQVVDDA
jgi:hypothetical protein